MKWKYLATGIASVFYIWFDIGPFPTVIQIWNMDDLWSLLRLMHDRLLFKIWWRHQMEKFSALLAIYAGNSPVTGEFPAQRTTRRFDVFFDLLLYIWLSKQWQCWWFETPSRPLWRNCNECQCLYLSLSNILTNVTCDCKLSLPIQYSARFPTNDEVA